MKRPDTLIMILDVHAGVQLSGEDAVALHKYIAHLESQLQPQPECDGVTDDTEAVQAMLDKSQPRKTVSDAVDYFDGVWPDDNATNIKFLIPHKEFIFDSIPVQDESRCYQVCTREEFEAEVERRNGEEWTHRTNAGELCKIHVKEPDVNGVIIVLNERGEYLRHNSDSLNPTKPTISKGEAWSKLVKEMEGPEGKSAFSAFYDILEQFEVK